MKKAKKKPLRFVVPFVLGVAALIAVFAFVMPGTEWGRNLSASVSGSADQTGLIVSPALSEGVPVSNIIEVKRNHPTTNVELLKFTLTANTEEDLVITRLPITVSTSDDSISNVVTKLILKTDANKTFSKAIRASDSDDATVMFSEGGFTIPIDAGESVEVTVLANIEERYRYPRGTIVRASMTNSNRQAIYVKNDNDDLVSRYGQAVGSDKALYDKGLFVDVVSGDAEVLYAGALTNDDRAVFRISFDVTAFGSNIFVPKSISLDPTGIDTHTFRIENQTLGWLPPGTPGITYTIQAATAVSSPSGANYIVPEGKTERFTVIGEINNAFLRKGSRYRALIPKIKWSDMDSTNYSDITFGLEGLVTGYVTIN